MRALGTFLFLCAFAGVIAAAVYFQFFLGQGGKNGEDAGGKQPVLVTVAAVGNHDFVDVIEAIGTSKANESIELTAKATETIGALNFEGGQKVEAGFVVAELTSREQSADLAAARAELNEAKLNFERVNGLSAKGFSTKAQLDQATAARDSAAAKVRSLESRVTDRLIKAPFAGVLGLRRVSVGSLVKPGDIITTLDDISVIKVDFTVPEVFLGSMTVGMEIRTGVEAYPNRAFVGKVVGIDTRVDPVSRAVAVRAEIANDDGTLRSGMLMTVSVLRNKRVSLSVREESLVPLDDKQYVYVVAGDMKAERREVKIGARSPGAVEILSGLKAGDKVVVDGTIRLRPGAPVKIAGPEKAGKANDKGGNDAVPPHVNLSDISIRRPVFATVIALMIATFGIISFQRLPLRELPNIDPPVVSVQTTYTGASAAVVETRVTKPIEDSIAGIEGIDTIASSSRDGSSSITVTFRLSRDIEAAANDIRNAVARTLQQLPQEIDPPQVQKTEADSSPIMFLNMSSTTMSLMQLTDYARRYIVDRFSTIDGVAQVRSFGEDKSLHIWLDRVALAARGLTVSDIEDALRAQNVELPAGRLESTQRNLTIRVERGYATAIDFRNLVVKRTPDGHFVRLGEVGQVEITALERRTDFRGNGQRLVGIGIVKQSTANQIDVARAVRAEIEKLNASLPRGTSIVAAVDYTVFIEQSVSEVYTTLAITGGLVLIVIYLFLGNLRAAIVPAVTVPVCLLGSMALLAAFGASINLLTLLALVLAIGLVVDDAIVVLENVQRRVDLGEPPLIAALRGTRQVAFAVMATTAVLIAVFVPIVFLQGTIGRLFSELGIALGSAVAISLLIALTLSPMMCSKLLKPVEREGVLSRLIHGATAAMASLYRAMLEASLAVPALVVMMFVGVIVIAGILYRLVPGEIAPTEDRGIFDINVSMPEGTGYDAVHAQMVDIEKVLMPLVKAKTATRIIIRAPGSFGSTADFNSGRGIVVLGPWGTRPPQEAVIQDVTKKLRRFAAIRATAIARSSFGRGGGGSSTPVQFVLGGSSFEELVQWRDKLLEKAESFPGLVAVDSDYKETKPQLNVSIDRTRAAELGVSVATIGHTLETMLGQRKVGTFIERGEEYDVIVQGSEARRSTLNDLTNILVRSERTGALIPLSNLLTTNESASASSLNRFNRLRAITISANLAPGTTLGQALNFLEQTARAELPATAQIAYKGQSQEYKESSSTLAFTFGLALVVVFLVLAAQFESFVHPLVIILTVPLAVAGALFGLWISGATLNIYSQIGIVMLVGLAAKNGILIVEFANQLRDQGHDIRSALVEASVTRFRPILMTSLATAMGAVPLMVFQGAGTQSRFAIGIVIFAGVIFSTGLTLFVVPAFYNLLARFTRSPGEIGNEIAEWERVNPGVAGGAAHAAGGPRSLREKLLAKKPPQKH